MPYRAVELAIARPLSLDDPRSLEGLVHECWEHPTRLANWAVAELRDFLPLHLPGEDELPPFPSVQIKENGYYLYGKAQERYPFWSWWQGMKREANNVLNMAASRYKALWKGVWWGLDNPPNFRWPTPFALHGQSWSVRMENLQHVYRGKPQKRMTPVVNLVLPGGRVDVALDADANRWRQVEFFRKIAGGEAKQTELVLHGRLVSNSCHRFTVQVRAPGGGRRQYYRVMVKAVAEVEAAEAKGARSLSLIHDKDALLLAEIDGRREWIVNADHIKRLFGKIAEHERLRQRLAEDAKAERRLRVPKQRLWLDRLRAQCQRHHCQINTWLHEITSQVASFARRIGAAEVLYDDGEKSFIRRFPWADLKRLLGEKLELLNIRLHVAGEAGSNDDAA